MKFIRFFRPQSNAVGYFLPVELAVFHPLRSPLTTLHALSILCTDACSQVAAVVLGRGGTQEVDFMDAGSPQRRPQRPAGRERAPGNTWRKETFWIASGCFARARVFHALQHYVAHLEARVKKELLCKWTSRCDHIPVRAFLADCIAVWGCLIPSC